VTDIISIIGQHEKKLTKLQQQNATLADNEQRRLTGQQFQQGQVNEFIFKKTKYCFEYIYRVRIQSIHYDVKFVYSKINFVKQKQQNDHLMKIG